MTTRRVAVLLMIGAGLTVPTYAQFTQYTPPGGVEFLEASSIHEELDEAIQNARWRLGKLFVDPWIQLKDLGYDDNVGNRPEPAEKLSDVTATLGLGLRGYVPTGEHSTFALHALPEYVWWDELDERRRVNGSYGIGFFSSQGRFNLALSATKVDDSRFFSRELEDRVNITDERASASLDFALGKGFALFSSATLGRLEFDGLDENAPNLSSEDREERIGSLGVRRKLRSGLSAGVGFEVSDVDFDERGNPRSNTGQAPFVEVVLDRDKLRFIVLVALRDLEFADPLLRYEEPSGRFWAGWRPVDSVEFQMFGNQNLVYSFDERWAYFEDSSLGGAVVLRAGTRLLARLFSESGSNNYTKLDPLADVRLEDFTARGARLEITLGKVTTVIGASRTEYDSTIPSLDRTVDTVTVGVVVGSDGDSPWS